MSSIEVAAAPAGPAAEDDPVLPFTGTDIAAMGLAGALLTAMGAALLGLGRSPHRHGR